MDTLDMRYFEAHGRAQYDPALGWQQVNGTVGWTLEPGTRPLQTRVRFSESLEPNYLVQVTPLNQGQGAIPHAACSNVSESGFDVELEVPEPGAGLGFTFSVRGTKLEVVMDDRSIPKDRLVEDVHALRQLFTHEAEFGVVTVMCSASIESAEKIRRDQNTQQQRYADTEARLKATEDPAVRARLEAELASIRRRLARLERLARPEVVRYWDSAQEFGRLWGEYSAKEQPAALGGRFVPICTGGGPGIMAAVAKGGRLANAQVIGIDSLFGNEPRHDLAGDFSVYSNIRLRCNDFAIREAALINYSHVILFWPGGFGTAWEAFETLSKLQTKHLRPRRTKAIFVFPEFWQPVFDAIGHFREVGTTNAYGDRIKIPGVDDKDPDDAYLAVVARDEKEAFDIARAHVEMLHAQNRLSIF